MLIKVRWSVCTRNIKDGEKPVVLIADKIEICLHSSDAGIANV